MIKISQRMIVCTQVLWRNILEAVIVSINITD